MVNKYSASNTKNIVYFLQIMAIFIKQRQLGNKTSKDIPQIAEFGSIAWDFICTIYESG